MHNLEHGGVVFLYNCPLGCEDEIADLQSVMEARPGVFFVCKPLTDHPHHADHLVV